VNETALERRMLEWPPVEAGTSSPAMRDQPSPPGHWLLNVVLFIFLALLILGGLFLLTQ
jgi:hypothetical protein